MSPLEDNLPNMPTPRPDRVFRINDGNDSNIDRENVIAASAQYPLKFFNTAIPRDLAGFPGPVVLTVNPGAMTDRDFHRIDPIPVNLMAVRIRVNMWNLESVVDPAVAHFAERSAPVFLTFMAYFKEPVREGFSQHYVKRKRTLNEYYAITTDAWETVMARYRYNRWVYSCGKVEGEKGGGGCRHCGNCLREFFATRERMETRP